MRYVKALIPHPRARLLRKMMTECDDAYAVTDIADIIADVHTSVLVHGFGKWDVLNIINRAEHIGRRSPGSC